MFRGDTLSPSFVVKVVYELLGLCVIVLSAFMCGFFFFWLRWVFVAACGLSLVVASRGYSSLWCVGFSLRWLLFVAEHGL